MTEVSHVVVGNNKLVLESKCVLQRKTSIASPEHPVYLSRDREMDSDGRDDIYFTHIQCDII